MSETTTKTGVERPLVPLQGLLDFLDSDAAKAEEKYALIRRKLIKFLQLRGAAIPEDLADETMARVAFKVEQGLEKRACDPYPYFCGVAIRLLKVATRKRARELRAFDQWSREAAAAQEPDPEAEMPAQKLDSLRLCLRKLRELERHLILKYYTGDGKDRIETRKRLAQEKGIPLNALRIRAWRIREKLQACVRQGLVQ